MDNQAIDFSDLDDLDDAPTRQAKAQEKFPCVKCAGTGQWTGGYVNITTRKCFACNGCGFFLTSPEQHAKSHKKSAKRKQAKSDAYRDQHKDLVEYLEEVKGWNDFANSMLEAITKYGHLTEGQERAAYNGMAKHLDRKEEQAKKDANAPVLDLTRINQMFDSAKSSGLKKPKLRVGHLTIQPAPASGKNAGFLYVKDYGNYAGKISAEGKLFLMRDARESLEEELMAIAADPIGKLTEHGRITGNCSCCGRDLTNKESVERGIGPICAERYGLI